MSRSCPDTSREEQVAELLVIKYIVIENPKNKVVQTLEDLKLLFS